MKDKKGLLYFLNGNLQMAMLTTTHMIKISNDEKLRASLLEDLHTFEKFENAILNIKHKDVIKPLSDMAQKNTEWGMNIKTAVNDSSENMRNMLVTGYEKGIKSINDNIEKFSDDDPKALELAKGYRDFLKLCLAKYKGF